VRVFEKEVIKRKFKVKKKEVEKGWVELINNIRKEV